MHAFQRANTLSRYFLEALAGARHAMSRYLLAMPVAAAAHSIEPLATLLKGTITGFFDAAFRAPAPRGLARPPASHENMILRAGRRMP